MRPILFFLILISTSIAFAQQDEGERFVVVPIVGANGDQGLGTGLDMSWINIQDTSWIFRSHGYYGFNYQQTFLGASLTNRNLADLFFVSLSAGYQFSRRMYFYGHGNMTSQDDPTQFSILSHKFEGKLGINIYENLTLGVGSGYTQTEVGYGSYEGFPQYIDFYTQQRLRRGTLFRPLQGFLLYDTQTPQLAPQSGNLLQVTYEQNQKQNDEPDYAKLQAIAQRIQPISGQSLVSVFRIRHERVWGGDLPFFGQARLGGMSTLRSYRSGRYTDFASILYAVEPRWVFWRPGDWAERLEFHVAAEAGRVYNSGTITTLYDQLHMSWVTGLTIVLDSGVPLRLDVGAGPEGTQAYLHLFYPF